MTSASASSYDIVQLPILDCTLNAASSFLPFARKLQNYGDAFSKSSSIIPSIKKLKVKDLVTLSYFLAIKRVAFLNFLIICTFLCQGSPV